MRKRILSLLLAMVLVLGLVPVTAMADDGLHGDTNNNGKVDVYLSLSYDNGFQAGEGTGKVMALVPVSVPYFDLGDKYGLDDFYFSNEFYEQNDSGSGSNLNKGSATTADGKVTPLHLFIYATESYYCNAAEYAGTGYLYDEGLLGAQTFEDDGIEDVLYISGSPGSSYLNKFWNYGENLVYFRNYEYPEASPGWGSTSDQILLSDGDIVTVGAFSSTSFYMDPAGTFNYIKVGEEITAEQTVTKGDKVELTVMRACENVMAPDGTDHNPVRDVEVYYSPVEGMPSAWSDWNSLEGTTSSDGKITLDTANLEPGTYMVAVPGMPGDYTGDIIVSAPGGMLLTVEAPEADDDQDSGSNNQPSSNTLNGDTNKNGTVDVTMTISDGVDDFYDTPEENKRLLVQEMNVPYFDLALYDLDRFYYNPDCYTGTSQQAGTAQTAKNVVTTMHAFIWATEVYVLGYDPEDAGKGYKGDYDAEVLLEYINFDMDGGVGSTFMKFWNGSTNINYYLDYAFPLGREGWGSTSDQQALSDGTAINIHLISKGSSASGSNYSFFEDASEQRDKTTVTQGTAPTLTLYKTITNYGNATPTTTQSGVRVYYINTNEYSGQKVTEWTSAGTTDGSGQITLPNTLDPGTYYVSSLGQDGGMQLAPAAFILTVKKDIGNVILGDVNEDDEVNSLDAVLILRKIAGTLGQANFTETAADVNGADGITSLDAVLILRKAAGLISKFPAE